jgi:hypothetical protein
LTRQKLSVSYVPFCDGWPILFGRLQSAYACENHVRFYGGACEVEMYVSFLLIFVSNPLKTKSLLKTSLIPDDGPPCPSRHRRGERDGKSKQKLIYHQLEGEISFQIQHKIGPFTNDTNSIAQ